jgi:hypothetical protein
MILLITLIFLGLLVLNLVDGYWEALWWLPMGWGITLFIWFAIRDFFRDAAGYVSPQQHDHYHLTQNRYDLGESRDPTRPDSKEDYPAIIEINGRKYRRTKKRV